MAVIDPGETKKAVEAFAAEFGWSFDVLLDSRDDVARSYGVRGHPMTFLISPKGRIIGVILGFRDWSSKQAFSVVEQLLSDD